MAHRIDSVGLFWEDVKKVKPPKKEKIRRTPPARTWEEADYLPNILEARAMRYVEFNDIELWQASLNKETLVYDIESYPNYTLFLFRSIESRKCVIFEISDIEGIPTTMNLAKFQWVLSAFRQINFNGRKYDIPLSAIASLGVDSYALYEATKMLIEKDAFGENMQAKEVLKTFGAKKLFVDQIDLIELTALRPGLKTCAGRLHAKRMQDLPIKHGSMLSFDQALITKWYCFNDLDNTELLYESVKEQVGYREEIGKQYDLDLRSHSDAQMAEAIISSEIRKLTGQKRISRTEIPPGTTYRYNPPDYIKFHSKLLNHVLDTVKNALFIVDHNGNIAMPPELKELVVTINKSSYQMGIGGLHSQEKSVAHHTDDRYVVIDTDVTSYYPFLILNSGITPANLGQNFLRVYRNIVDTRVKAKEQGNSILAEVLKIVVNGTFGKLGSMWSIMYAPDLMLRVTLTGQLSILMLVEMFEMSGIEVTSVNTDGIVVKCLREKEEEFHNIVKYWEHISGLRTEETRYKATFSRDINNYIAVYEKAQKGKLYKAKGAYGPTAPKKNAVTEICSQAAAKYLLDHTSIEQTIRECKDIRQFTAMQFVNGGAVKDGEYLGKVIRWYYAEGIKDEIIYAKTGNKVSNTDGAKPLMVLPDSFPDDINYNWYIAKTEKILKEIGAITT